MRTWCCGRSAPTRSWAPDARRGGPRWSCGSALHAGDERADDLEPVVEHDDVGGRARGERAGSGRPASAAGTALAAASASSSGAPRAWSRRTAASIVSALPASRPSASRTTPASAWTGRPPRVNVPSPAPAAATASVTSATRPRAAAHATRMASSATWWPSAMSCTTTSSRASAARASPGSRATGGRIALKRCVTVRAPRSKAACASSAVASEWPAATSTPRPVSSAISSSAPGSSGARVTCATGPAASRRSSSARSGSRRCSGGCAPSRAGERNGPSRWAPRMRGRLRAAAIDASAPAISSSAAVITVGR